MRIIMRKTLFIFMLILSYIALSICGLFMGIVLILVSAREIFSDALYPIFKKFSSEAYKIWEGIK